VVFDTEVIMNLYYDYGLIETRVTAHIAQLTKIHAQTNKIYVIINNSRFNFYSDCKGPIYLPQ